MTLIDFTRLRNFFGSGQISAIGPGESEYWKPQTLSPPASRKIGNHIPVGWRDRESRCSIRQISGNRQFGPAYGGAYLPATGFQYMRVEAWSDSAPPSDRERQGRCMAHRTE